MRIVHRDFMSNRWFYSCFIYNNIIVKPNNDPILSG